MKTFKDIQVGDILVELFYDPSDTSYSPLNYEVTEIKRNEIFYRCTEFNNGVTHSVRLSDLDTTVYQASYFDSDMKQYIFSDKEAARNFLISTRNNFIENINKTLNAI